MFVVDRFMGDTVNPPFKIFPLPQQTLGIPLTKINVFGRGKQNGIIIGTTHYDELPKSMIMLVVEDKFVEEVVKLIKCKAYTGNYGDGKIFVTPVDDAYTIRTGVAGL